MSNIKSRIYYNPSYQGCNYQPCYFIYIKNGGMYLSTAENTFRALDTPTFELNDGNIDSYVEARGFIKVLDRTEDGIIIYYNDFSSPEKREDISRQLDKFKQSVDLVKYSSLNKKALGIAYGTANSIQTNM